jgi:hypothetical protein
MPVSRSGWVTLVSVLYLISGAFNLLIGLVALGVSLSGSATVDRVYVGDWPTDNLEGAAIVVIVLASLQLLLGAGTGAAADGRGSSAWSSPRWWS